MNLDILKERSLKKLKDCDLSYIRSLMYGIDWDLRLLGVKGGRGVGKTTLLLQRLKLMDLPSNEGLYASCDNLWFSKNTLVGLADEFSKQGGRFLFLDEVHKYPNWSQELKNIYDDYSELNVVFTGSSLLEILNARADLSRRAIIYDLQGLSFREYLKMETGYDFRRTDLETLIEEHVDIAELIVSEIRPLQYFNDYLKSGYYPFYRESLSLYHQRIEEIVSLILHIELPLLRNIDVSYIFKIKQLLQIIAESVPFVPNVSKLSERIGVNRNTFISYLYYINEAGLTTNLYKDLKGISRLQKPDKIYLDNPNLHWALSSEKPNTGHLRECFFLNQLQYNHKVEYINAGDFKVDFKYTFEIGGKSKTAKQLGKSKHSYVIPDNIEVGNGNKIPLWVFGFLY
ncbi:MAG: AAA family ATPase [Bacteroidia bacterium]